MRPRWIWPSVWMAALLGGGAEFSFSTLGAAIGSLPLWLNLLRLALSPPAVIWLAFADARPFSVTTVIWQFAVAGANALLYSFVALVIVGATKSRRDRL